jgi:hypothetical protein
MLESNINRRLATILGGATAGITTNLRPVRLTEDEDGWRVEMTEREGKILYSAEIPHQQISRTLPEDSVFPNATEASRFILEMSFGGQWLPRKKSVCLLAETHVPCDLAFARCKTTVNTFVEGLAGKSVDADHVLSMTNVPHQFALRGVLSQTTAACGNECEVLSSP